MKIALDRKADECIGDNLIQLRTPLTGYARKDGVPWVMDNGAFTDFDKRSYSRMAQVAINDPECVWFTLPDVVGSHDETRLLFDYWKIHLTNFFIPEPDFSNKAAFVIQDGANIFDIPWSEITAVFLGGTTKFKLSREAFKLLEYAKHEKKKWVHVGRVNTQGRIGYFHGIADSIDGSGIARFDHMLDKALNIINHLNDTKATRIEDYA